MSERMRVRELLWRLLSTNNPCYLISAGLILYGLRLSFGSDLDVINSWLLLVLLSAYTLLLAGTAYVIVRHGKVWDDARTILLVLLFLFLALSVSFDDLLVMDAAVGMRLILYGFALCVIVTEGLLRGLAMRFPWPFRLPYYALLSLIFWYPLAMNAVLQSAALSSGFNLAWGILLYSVLAGCGLLLLVPAIRYGRRYAAKNGTPWQWPWYPLPVFFFLALGAGWRIYALAMSFGVDPIFGTYFLIPFLLAVAAVVLELGIERKQLLLQVAAMGSLVAVIWCGFPASGGSVMYAVFLEQFTGLLGSPAWVCSWAVVGFGGYTWWRGLRAGEAVFCAALVWSSIVTPETLAPAELVLPQAPHLLGLSVLQMLLLYSRFHSARLFAATATLLAAATVAGGETLWAGWRVAIPLHALWLLMLVVGGLGRDRFARWMRRTAAASACATVLLPALQEQGLLPLPPWVLAFYLCGLAGVLWGYWLWVEKRESRVFLSAWLINTLLAGSLLSWHGYQVLAEGRLAKGLHFLTGGVVFLLAALLISLAKAELIQPLLSRAKAWLLPPLSVKRLAAESGAHGQRDGT